MLNAYQKVFTFSRMLDDVRKQLFNIGSEARAERETFSLNHIMVIEKKMFSLHWCVVSHCLNLQLPVIHLFKRKYSLEIT